MRGFGWVVAMCLCGNSLHAQAAFVHKKVADVDRPNSMVIADFNGDSKPDIAVGGWEGTSILLNAGNAGFAEAIYLSRVMFPQLAADFDSDGKVDLIATSVGSQPSVAGILKGRGDGGFEPAEALRTGIHNVAAADFNDDSVLDLVLYDTSTSYSFLLLGRGDGTFDTATYIDQSNLGTDGLTLTVRDVNGDRRSDIVLFDGWTVRIFLAKGDGTFHAPVETFIERMPGSNTHYSSSDVLLGDFNGDGRPDVVSRSNVMLGRGDGTFHSPLFFTDASTVRTPYCRPAETADLNGDGYLDLILVYGTFDPVSVFHGRGDGTLLPPVDHSSIGRIVAVADLDGDRRPDPVGAHQMGSLVSVLLNRQTSEAAAGLPVSDRGPVVLTAQ